MQEILQNKIFAAFPSLYCRKDLNQMETCMCWGLECGDGWFDLIYKLSEDIVKISKDVRADQVKEKFGGLRFYYSFEEGTKISEEDDQKIYDLICKAEDESYTICEYCGSKENVHQTFGWVRTVCDECLDDSDEVNTYDEG